MKLKSKIKRLIIQNLPTMAQVSYIIILLFFLNLGSFAVSIYNGSLLRKAGKLNEKIWKTYS